MDICWTFTKGTPFLCLSDQWHAISTSWALTHAYRPLNSRAVHASYTHLLEAVCIKQSRQRSVESHSELEVIQMNVDLFNPKLSLLGQPDPSEHLPPLGKHGPRVILGPSHCYQILRLCSPFPSSPVE